MWWCLEGIWYSCEIEKFTIAVLVLVLLVMAITIDDTEDYYNESCSIYYAEICKNGAVCAEAPWLCICCDFQKYEIPWLQAIFLLYCG